MRTAVRDRQHDARERRDDLPHEIPRSARANHHALAVCGHDLNDAGVCRHVVGDHPHLRKSTRRVRARLTYLAAPTIETGQRHAVPVRKRTPGFAAGLPLSHQGQHAASCPSSHRHTSPPHCASSVSTRSIRGSSDAYLGVEEPEAFKAMMADTIVDSLHKGAHDLNGLIDDARPEGRAYSPRNSRFTEHHDSARSTGVTSPHRYRCVLFEKQGSHDQKGQERDGDRVNVLRPRHADAERKPDARHADRIEQLAAE